MDWCRFFRSVNLGLVSHLEVANLENAYLNGASLKGGTFGLVIRDTVSEPCHNYTPLLLANHQIIDLFGALKEAQRYLDTNNGKEHITINSTD